MAAAAAATAAATATQHTETARIKVVVLGCPRAGKTSVVSRLVGAGFTAEYHATLGVDYTAVSHNACDDTNVDTSTTFSDIGGDACYAEFEPKQLEHTDAVILVYNLWWRGACADYAAKIRMIKDAAPPSTPIVLVGTHLDCLHHPIDGQDAEIAHAKTQHAISEKVEANVYAGKTYLVSCKTADGFDDLQMALACIRKTRWQFYTAAKIAARKNAHTASDRREYSRRSLWAADRVLLGMAVVPRGGGNAVVARGSLAALVAKKESDDSCANDTP